MSDYHILSQAENRKTATVVFHIPIPATDNAVEVSWQEAVLREQGGAAAVTSVLPEVVGEAEEDDMKTGAIFEEVATVRFSIKGLTNQQRLAEIATAFTNRSSELVTEKQITLNFFGKVGNVA